MLYSLVLAIGDSFTPMVEPGAKLKNWNKTQRLARLLSPFVEGTCHLFWDRCGQVVQTKQWKSHNGINDNDGLVVYQLACFLFLLTQSDVTSDSLQEIIAVLWVWLLWSYFRFHRALSGPNPNWCQLLLVCVFVLDQCCECVLLPCAHMRLNWL